MAKKQLQLFEINKIIILNFSFLQRVYLLNLFSAIFVYVYNNTPCRSCISIITVNREKFQIIKSQCWRFHARHKLWNSKRQEIPLSDEGGISALTKLAVWVQFKVKKNRVDDKNLLHLKYLTCQKLRLFFSVLIKISFHRLFCPIPQLRLICSSFEFRSYYDKSDDFEQEGPWKNMEVDLHGFQSEK